MEYSQLISIAAIAVFASFGHCIGMCGGIVLAYTGSKIDNSFSKTKIVFSHLLYGIGRVSVYVVLGAFFGLIGSFFLFNRYLASFFYIFVGVLMVLAGLSMVGKISFLSKIEHSFSNSSLFKNIFLKQFKSTGYMSFYTLGIINGFLPCGLVYFFLFSAASSGSPHLGALIMFVFGICTLPPLFLVGIFASSFLQGPFRSASLKLASILVIIYGIFTLYSAYDIYTNTTDNIMKH